MEYVLLIFLLVINLVCSERCGLSEASETYLNLSSSSLSKRNTDSGNIYSDCYKFIQPSYRASFPSIPVVFSIVQKGYNGREDGVIDDDTVLKQFNLLQEFYSPIGIDFFLQNTTRYYMPDLANKIEVTATSPIDGDLVKLLALNDPGIMHVIVTDYSQFGIGMPACVRHRVPSYSDVIVLAYRAFLGSSVSEKAEGKTLIHEAGHFLGLLHTFEGQECSPTNDYVKDTPPERKSEECQAPARCPNCQFAPPSYGNIMTYRPDNCRGGLTAGQAGRIHYMTQRFRYPDYNDPSAGYGSGGDEVYVVSPYPSIIPLQ